MRTLYLDLETTGLDPARDEILDLAILDDDDQPVLDTLVRPMRHTDWPRAQVVNGIAPADVRDAPTLDALRPAIAAAVRDARLVIYNAPFDAAFLPDEVAQAAEMHCAMRAFAELHGDWSDKYGNWRWSKLTVAASTVGFTWNTSAHRALADCRATRAVWRYTQDPAQTARRRARQRQAARHATPADGAAADHQARVAAVTARLRTLLGLDAADPRDRPDLTELFQGTAIRRRRARSAPIDPARED